MKKTNWKENPIRIISENLTDIMKTRNIKNTDIADKILSAHKISRIKNGYRKDIDIISLIRLCQRIRIHPNDLLNSKYDDIWNNICELDDDMISNFAKALRTGVIKNINPQKYTITEIYDLYGYFLDENSIQRIEKVNDTGKKHNSKRLSILFIIDLALIYAVEPESIIDELINYIVQKKLQ